MRIVDYYRLFMDYLAEEIKLKNPKNLYEPEVYIMGLGGKRLRPVLTLIAAEAFGGIPEKALPASLALEVFHNFTLLHDDVMDEAPIRRGKATVHEKWDRNTAILSGDLMLIHSYQLLEAYSPEVFKEIIQVFSKTAVEVCEGQQYDMDFENQENVSLPEYLKMIQYKTAVLVAAALKIGAIIAGASIDMQEKMYRFGILIGLAFQLQDDYLDTFGNQDTFGKRIGGDILEKKKTWLYVKMTELISGDTLDSFKHAYSQNNIDENKKIKEIQGLFKSYSIDTLLTKEIKKYSTEALQILDTLDITKPSKHELESLVLQLEDRKQ